MAFCRQESMTATSQRSPHFFGDDVRRCFLLGELRRFIDDELRPPGWH
jgi:hypothetical protein